MVHYSRVKSTQKPDSIEVRETKVFIASNIKEVSENVGDENEFVGFEFDWLEYEKDEYILLQAEKNSELEDQLTDTQLALCEIFESLGV